MKDTKLSKEQLKEKLTEIKETNNMSTVALVFLDMEHAKVNILNRLNQTKMITQSWLKIEGNEHYSHELEQLEVVIKLIERWEDA